MWRGLSDGHALGPCRADALLAAGATDLEGRSPSSVKKIWGNHPIYGALWLGKSVTIDLDFSTSNGKMVGFLHLQWKHVGKNMGTSHQEKGGFNGNMLEADRTK